MCVCAHTLREAGAGACGHAKAGGGDSEGADVLLRLEQDDVDLWSKQAAQHHRATQADGDAHGGGLNLGEERGVMRSMAVDVTNIHISSLTSGSSEEGKRAKAKAPGSPHASFQDKMLICVCVDTRHVDCLGLGLGLS